MTGAFDPRVIKVGVQIKGQFIFFQDLDIRVRGQRFASQTSAFAEIQLSNLTYDQRNWLLTNATPVAGASASPAYLTVDIGRVKTGLFRLFQGNCYTSTVTPPPDIGILFRSIDGLGLSSILQPNSFANLTQLRTIAQSVADKAEPPLTLDFGNTQDRQIANYSVTTNTNSEIQKLADIGDIIVFRRNGVLVVRDKGGFCRAGFTLSQDTGMVGVPQATENGCIAQMLISADVDLFDRITIDSKINPSVKGDYVINQIAFDAANRDNPFFYTLVCTKFGLPASSQPGTL